MAVKDDNSTVGSFEFFISFGVEAWRGVLKKELVEGEVLIVESRWSCFPNHDWICFFVDSGFLNILVVCMDW
jgi:hypothetical protein